jgi:uncharacterized DUF497 family protein
MQADRADVLGDQNDLDAFVFGNFGGSPISVISFRRYRDVKRNKFEGR